MLYSFTFCREEEEGDTGPKSDPMHLGRTVAPVELGEDERRKLMPIWRCMKQLATDSSHQQRFGQVPFPANTTYIKLMNILCELGIGCKRFCALAEGPGSMALALLAQFPTCVGTGLTLPSRDDRSWAWLAPLRPGGINEKRFRALEGDVMTFDARLLGGDHDLVVADGGVDSRETQERDSFRLFAGEAVLATQIIALHGTFVMKIYDTFLAETHTMLWALAHVFKRLILTHGVAVRAANAERYLVCQDYMGKAGDIPDTLSASFVAFLDKANQRSLAVRQACNVAIAMGFDAIPESLTFEDAHSYFDAMKINPHHKSK